MMSRIIKDVKGNGSVKPVSVIPGKASDFSEIWLSPDLVKYILSVLNL